MAEASERPTPVSPAPMPVPAGDRPADPVVYRPLSLLAVCGVGVSGLYAVVVGLCSLVAFARGEPWLYPTWTLLGLAGAAVSYIALVRVQRSEGTLAGERLARWGLTLGLFVPLGYWAYYGATYLAVRRQADAEGRRFLTTLGEGKVHEAFLMTQRPGERRPDEASMREELEVRFNTIDEKSRKGLLTDFEQWALVRMLASEPGEVKIESRGVGSWEFKEGGYQVANLYRVTTDDAVLDVSIAVQGVQGGSSGGRQWYVLKQNSDHLSSERSEAGAKKAALQGEAQAIMETFLRNITQGAPEASFLLTREPAERERLREQFPQEMRERGSAVRMGLGLTAGALSVGAGPIPVAVQTALGVDEQLLSVLYLPGYREFLTGEMVRVTPGDFWAPRSVKATDVLQGVRAHFQRPTQNLGRCLEPDRTMSPPITRVVGDRLQVECDILMKPSPRALSIDKKPMLIEGRLVVDCDARSTTAQQVPWRVRSLDLIRAKSGLLAELPPPSTSGGPPR